jgi:hypothetical protein
MRQMQEHYDPKAANSVVIFTDGANHDPGGPGLKRTLAELNQIHDPAKPVRLICIGIGAEADMAELTQLASHGGGVATLAKTPQQLPTLLFELMNQRRD